MAKAGLALLLIGSSISLLSFYSLPRYAEQDYRPVAERMNALALPNDVVVLVHPWQVGFMQAYLRVPATLQMVVDPAWGEFHTWPTSAAGSWLLIRAANGELLFDA